MKEAGDPVTGFAMGSTDVNLKSAVKGETYEYTQMYPGFARTAREEGFTEVAEWFETLARAEKSHAGPFRRVSTTSEASEPARLIRSASDSGFGKFSARSRSDRPRRESIGATKSLGG